MRLPRGRFSRTLIAIVAIVAVVMTYRVLAIYEFRSGDCSARTPGSMAQTFPKRLVVMSYNIQGHASLLKPQHIEEIAATIRRHNPDVVAINEAHRGTWQARFGDHMEQLRRLTGLNGAFGRSYAFLGGEFGNAVLTRGEVLRVEVHKLPGTGEPRTLFESVVRVNGGVIEMYTTHLTAWGGMNSEARDIQLECLSDHVAASAHPFILAGDINAAPDAVEVAKFLAKGIVRPALVKPLPTHRVMQKQLDHILLGPGWQVRNARVLDDGPSDHRPVIAELIAP